MANKLAILLCTYNGERFLQEQLDSYTSQTFKGWDLFVYDDGSTDGTQSLITSYKKARVKQNPVHWCLNQVKRGFAQNFLHAISSTPAEFDFYAWSDQDDIWCPHKLERAVNYLKSIPSEVPAIYCTRTILVDSEGHRIGMSPLFSHPTSFENALVQSIAGGNTMVFNRAVYELLCAVVDDVDAISHDWFLYQLVTGAGGIVYYDSDPEILYRQHGSNLIGSNAGIWAKILRIRMLFAGSFREWNDRNWGTLKRHEHLLTSHNRLLLDNLLKARKAWVVPRLLGMMRAKIYRQTLAGNIALFIGGMTDKI